MLRIWFSSLPSQALFILHWDQDHQRLLGASAHRYRAGAERGPLFCQCAARCMMWAGRAQGSAVIEGERERKSCGWKKDSKARKCHRNDCGLEPKERKIVRYAVIHYRQVWKTKWCHQNLNPTEPENTFWFVGQKRMGGQKHDRLKNWINAAHCMSAAEED